MSILDVIGALTEGYVTKKSIGKAQKALEGGISKGETATTGAYQTARGYQQPYYDYGTEGMKNLYQMINSGRFQTDPYNYNPESFNYATDPGYQFRMQQGQSAINSGAAAGGMQLSGATQKALQRYGQNFASNEFGNTFDRYNTNRAFGATNEMNKYTSRNEQNTGMYNRMAGLANMGVGAAANLGNLATGYGSNMSDFALGRGNTQAQGIMGKNQAFLNMSQGVRQGLADTGNTYMGQSQGGQSGGGGQGNAETASTLMKFLPYLL